MGKLQGNNIDPSRDPRRQPLPKDSEQSVKPTQCPASKRSAKASTVVSSSKGLSKKEVIPEVSPKTAHPSPPKQSTPSQSQSTKVSTPGKRIISTTTALPSVIQTNAAFDDTPTQTGIQPVSVAMLSDTNIRQQEKAGLKEVKTISTTKPLTAEDYTEKQVAKKANPLYTDTSERLRRDNEFETQYVKGVGEVIIRHGPQTNSDAKPTTPRTLDDESFPVKSYLSRLRSVPTQYMTWNSETDSFEIITSTSENITIPAKAFSSISYNYECRKFYLCSNKTTSPMDHLEESILEEISKLLPS